MFGHPSVLSGQPTQIRGAGAGGHARYSLAAEDVIPLLGRPSSLRFLARSLLARSAAGRREIDHLAPEVARQPAARWSAGRR